MPRSRHIVDLPPASADTTELTDVRSALRRRLALAERSLRNVESRSQRAKNDGTRAPFARKGPRNSASDADRTSLRNEILRVEAALDRLDRGEFGLCFRCQIPLEPDRLDGDPTVVFCSDCLADSHRLARKIG